MSSKEEPINVFSPKFRTDEILDEIRTCLDKGWTGMGFKTNEFEEAWARYTGLSFSHFISSNTVGLHLALEIFKRRNGNKINFIDRMIKRFSRTELYMVYLVIVRT